MRNILVISDKKVKLEADYIESAFYFYDLFHVFKIGCQSGSKIETSLNELLDRIEYKQTDTHGILPFEGNMTEVISSAKETFSVFDFSVLMLYDNGKSAFRIMHECINQNISVLPFPYHLFSCLKNIEEESMK